MLLKEKKDDSNKKKEDKNIFVLMDDEKIINFDFKKIEDKKFIKGYLKRKRKQLKNANLEFNLM